MLLQDKVIVITGIGPGLGRKMALIGVAEGAKLALAARSKEFVSQVVEEIAGIGGEAIGIPTDVDDMQQCLRLAGAAIEKWGRIDALVNSAYIHGPFISFSESTIEQWQEIMSVNCFGALRMVKAVMPTMKAQKDGAIVNVSSQSSVQPYVGGGAYATAKAALEGATRQLAKELGPFNIRVNAARMGRMDGTPWHNARQWMAQLAGQSIEEFEVPLRQTIALGRLPPDEECAKSVLLLASDYCRVTTGTTIDINGGEYMAG